MKRFVVSDGSLNSYGFRVLTDGIDLKRFKDNPVMLFNHQRDDVFQPGQYAGPVGRWENLKITGDRLEADAVFDDNDPLGKLIASKVENGFLKAASVGIKILAVSEEEDVMAKGQTMPTVTKCELVEISVVDIPSNKNALALYDEDGRKMELTESNLSVALSAMLPKPEIKLTPNIMKLKILTAWAALSAFLGVTHAANAESTEVEVSQDRLADIDKELATLTALRASVTTLTNDLQTANNNLNEVKAELTAAQAQVVQLQAKLNLKPAEETVVKKEGQEHIEGSQAKALGHDMRESAAARKQLLKESGLA